jgi:hypothetical protein
MLCCIKNVDLNEENFFVGLPSLIRLTDFVKVKVHNQVLTTSALETKWSTQMQVRCLETK